MTVENKKETVNFFQPSSEELSEASERNKLTVSLSVPLSGDLGGKLLLY